MTLYNEYEIGDLVRLDIDITISGTYIDPNHVSLFVTDPVGVESAFIYGQTGSFINFLVKESVGQYYLDYYIPLSGQYKYRFYCSGTAWGAEWKRFVVKRE